MNTEVWHLGIAVGRSEAGSRLRRTITRHGRLLIGASALGLAVAAIGAAGSAAASEPEPTEYLRVCDVYGSGFYYIPGTETCLYWGGYVRFDTGFGNITDYGHGIDFADDIDTDGDGVPDTGDGKGDYFYLQARYAMQLSARAESEFGTLSSIMQINFNYDRDVDGAYHYTEFDHAYVELGGLRAGVADSYFSSFTGYAGGVISDDLGVQYGPFTTHQIGYTVSTEDGLSALVAMEGGSDGFFIGGYVPHMVAGASLARDWGGVSMVAGFDSLNEEGAAKLRLDLTVSDVFSLFGMVGLSTNDPAGTGIGNTDTDNYYAQWNGTWAVWAGANLQVTDKSAIYAQVAYDADRNFAAVLDFAYTVVPGLDITPEIAFRDNFDLKGPTALGGYLRFERAF